MTPCPKGPGPGCVTRSGPYFFGARRQCRTAAAQSSLANLYNVTRPLSPIAGRITTRPGRSLFAAGFFLQRLRAR